MEVLQTYYTSCRVGQSGASGFQFYSYSEGLTQEELFEIEKIGNYIAPINLPSNPTEDEIASLFPISFNYFKLKSGRVGVLQSVALSQDYSGRPGNFFSHAFILESGDFPFLPIMLYNSASFRTNLSSDEWNTTSTPTKLPTLLLESLLKNPNFNLSSIKDFLTENENENTFSQIINAIIENSVNSRKIVLSDNQINIALWLAAISFAFPLNLANTITFSTYSIDPANNRSLISATSPEGSRFNFSNESAFQFQYYVFNIPLNKCSIVNHSSLYADVANTSLTISYDRFVILHEFFDNFTYHFINKDIDLIYKIFSTSKGDELFQIEWFDLLYFISQFANDTYLKDFLRTNIQFLDTVLSNVITDNHSIIKFFSLSLSLLERTKNISDFIIIFNLYLSWLNMTVLRPDGENVNKDYLNNLLLVNEPIVKQISSIENYFETYFFNNDNLDLLNKYLSDTEINSFFTYYLVIINQNSILSNLKIDVLFSYPSFCILWQRFTQISNLRNFQMFFSTINKKANYLFFLNNLPSSVPDEYILEIVEKTYNNLEIDNLFDFIKRNNNVNLFSSLIPYFFNRINNKRVFFTSAINFFDTSNASIQKYENLIKIYIKNTIQSSELIELIQFVDNRGLNVILELITIFEEKVNFENAIKEVEGFKQVMAIYELKKKYEITTSSNSIELFLLLSNLNRNIYPTVYDVLKGVSSDFILSDEKFNSFATIFLHLLLPLISKEKDFYWILYFIENTKEQQLFFIIFKKELEKYLVQDTSKKSVFLLLIFFFKIDNEYNNLSLKYKKDIEDLLIVAMSKFDNSTLENFEMSIKTKNTAYINNLNDLFDKIKDKKQNRILRLKNIFRLKK